MSGIVGGGPSRTALRTLLLARHTGVDALQAQSHMAAQDEQRCPLKPTLQMFGPGVILYWIPVQRAVHLRACLFDVLRVDWQWPYCLGTSNVQVEQALPSVSTLQSGAPQIEPFLRVHCRVQKQTEIGCPPDVMLPRRRLRPIDDHGLYIAHFQSVSE